MDLVPRSKSLPVTPAGYRDQNAALARDLAPVFQITGKELSLKSIKGDFLGLEVDSTNLVGGLPVFARSTRLRLAKLHLGCRYARSY